MVAWLAGPRDAPAIPVYTGVRQSLAILMKADFGVAIPTFEGMLTIAEICGTLP